MTALTAIPAFVGRWALVWAAATGTVGMMLARTLWLAPRMDKRELLRAVVTFGIGTLPLTVVVAVVSGTMVVLQTSLYVERFGARSSLGWAAGYAVLWEFGPLLLGLMFAARVGARNAAELAQLSVGGQLEGLSGISLDPGPILIVPRVWGVLVSITLLSMPAFLIAILCEIVAAYFTLDIPVRVFLQTFTGMLSGRELAAGMIKVVCFGWAIALVSTAVGVRAKGGSRAVGQAAAAAVVLGAAAIFSLDLVLSATLSGLAALGGS